MNLHDNLSKVHIVLSSITKILKKESREQSLLIPINSNFFEFMSERGNERLSQGGSPEWSLVADNLTRFLDDEHLSKVSFILLRQE